MKKVAIASALGLMPFMAFAVENLTDLFDLVTSLMNSAIPLIFGLAFLYFIWGLVKYVYAGGDEKARKEGTNMIIWGVVIIFVMLSVWGLVNVLKNTLNLSGTTAPTELPMIPD